MEKVDQGSLGSFIQCIVCKRSYKSAQTTNLKNHIEAKHIDNVRFTCSVCGGIFSSRASFRTHSRNFHKEINVVPFDVSQIDQYWSLVSSLSINDFLILSVCKFLIKVFLYFSYRPCHLQTQDFELIKLPICIYAYNFYFFMSFLFKVLQSFWSNPVIS